MVNNLINFLNHNLTLSIAFALAIVAYVLFEVVSWLSSDSLTNQCKVNVSQLVSLFNHNDAIIIDIRAKEQYNASYIINSVNMLPADCDAQLPLIKVNSDKPIVIICETGKVSSLVAVNLRKNGIKQAFYLDGGLISWKASAMPLIIVNKSSNQDTKNLLDKVDKSEKVIIYTKDGCPYCLSAKNLLRNKNIKYKEIIVSVDHPESFNEMVQLSGGAKTVPQIFINSKHIGGFDALKELSDNGGLDQILR